MSEKRFVSRAPGRGFGAATVTTLGLCLAAVASSVLSGCGTGSKTSIPSLSGYISRGTITFTNVAGSNADTANITNTESSAAVQANIYNASFTESFQGNGPERVLDIQLGIIDDASLTAGNTFTISPTIAVATGKARVFYVETQGEQHYWDAQSGTVQVVSHDSKLTVLRVVDAALTPTANYGATVQPTGTFTVNAQGNFSAQAN